MCHTSKDIISRKQHHSININRLRIIMWQTYVKKRNVFLLKYYLYSILRRKNTQLCRVLHSQWVNINFETQIIPIWGAHSNKPLYTQANKQLPLHSLNSKQWDHRWGAERLKLLVPITKVRDTSSNAGEVHCRLLWDGNADFVNIQIELLHSEEPVGMKWFQYLLLAEITKIYHVIEL